MKRSLLSVAFATALTDERDARSRSGRRLLARRRQQSGDQKHAYHATDLSREHQESSSDKVHQSSTRQGADKTGNRVDKVQDSLAVWVGDSRSFQQRRQEICNEAVSTELSP